MAQESLQLGVLRLHLFSTKITVVRFDMRLKWNSVSFRKLGGCRRWDGGGFEEDSSHRD